MAWDGLQNHPSGKLTSLHSFDGTDGYTPAGALVQGTNGDFYGTTEFGFNYGPVFDIAPSGTLTTLHAFDVTDGIEPTTGLLQAMDGNFYGSTYAGGANNSGTVFEMTPSDALTTLYSFCSQGGANCTDGAQPGAGLVQATNGDLYGTTRYGGKNSYRPPGCGTIFKITLGGS